MDNRRAGDGGSLPRLAPGAGHVAGGHGLLRTWFGVGWTYALVLIPILILPAALDRPHDAALRTAPFVGIVSVIVSVVRFLRGCS